MSLHLYVIQKWCKEYNLLTCFYLKGELKRNSTSIITQTNASFLCMCPTQHEYSTQGRRRIDPMQLVNHSWLICLVSSKREMKTFLNIYAVSIFRPEDGDSIIFRNPEENYFIFTRSYSGIFSNLLLFYFFKFKLFPQHFTLNICFRFVCKVKYKQE